MAARGTLRVTACNGFLAASLVVIEPLVALFESLLNGILVFVADLVAHPLALRAHTVQSGLASSPIYRIVGI